MMRIRNSVGFTLVELLVVIAIIGILLGMLLPNVRRVGEASRRTQCQNNLRQIALANLNYESAHMCFPACTGIGNSDLGSSRRMSGFVAIMPFLEASNIYEQISKPSVIDGVAYPAFPQLQTVGYAPWETRIPGFLCPSLTDEREGIAPIHYGLCIGDRARNVGSPEKLRGGFGGSLRCKFDDITDGSSNTIMAGEVGSHIDKASENPYAINQPESILESPSEVFALTSGDDEGWTYSKGVALGAVGRGGHWADGRAGVALFNTILSPKSPSAAVEGSVGVDGIYSASGPHPGGAGFARFDGSVCFIGSDIDAGDSSSPTLTEEQLADGATSPYGAWGALGAINDGVVVDEY